MASLTAIREALAANLDTIPHVQVSAYLLSRPNPPCLVVQPASTTYDLAGQRGMDSWRLTVRAYVGAVSDRGAQKRLDRLLAGSGPESVKQAIESDAQLGGAAMDLHVKRLDAYRLYDLGGQPLLGAEWEVEVLASGD